ncbi:MAG: teichoic acid biosynthesis protein B [Prevotella sp.]|jgi:hypothetical protein|nr:teichoic acid biosynthesis protein B [Prevotella sp.]MCI1282843.1 teichoic acid biosynthesis protein B [Prevotella sp.]
MKRLIFMVLSALLIAIVPAKAQSTKSSKNKSLSEKVSGIWHKAKANVSDATKKVKEGIGIKSRPEDEIKIDGTYYMPLYTTNLYKKSETQTLKADCEKLFKARYPQAVVLTEAIPQTDWLTEPLETSDKIIGYFESLYCYILAKDGGDGYINAKFVFQKYKEVGKTFSPVVNMWPNWMRTDIFPNKVYQKLIEEQ